MMDSFIFGQLFGIILEMGGLIYWLLIAFTFLSYNYRQLQWKKEARHEGSAGKEHSDTLQQAE
jgi:hypothetical protein